MNDVPGQNAVGGQTPTDTPRAGQTSAEAGGSIRDRLRSPDDSRTDGTDSRGSGISDAGFVNTDSAATLAARGRDEHQLDSPTPPQARVIQEPRREDVDEAAARAAERKIAAMFILSVLAVIGFVVVFFAAPYKFGDRNNALFTPLLAILMAVALGGIGAGAVKWAKSIMIDEEAVQERHGFASLPEERAATAEALREGYQQTGLPRRKLLRTPCCSGPAPSRCCRFRYWWISAPTPTRSAPSERPHGARGFGWSGPMAHRSASATSRSARWRPCSPVCPAVTEPATARPC